MRKTINSDVSDAVMDESCLISPKINVAQSEHTKTYCVETNHLGLQDIICPQDCVDRVYDSI